MKKQYFINANIIDPFNSLNENGGLIISEDGKIEAIGKKVNSNNLPSREKPIDLKGKHVFHNTNHTQGYQFQCDLHHHPSTPLLWEAG